MDKPAFLDPMLCDLLVCPETRQPLRATEGGLRCDHTGVTYPSGNSKSTTGRHDLRLRRPRRVAVEHELGTGIPDFAGVSLDPLRRRSDAEVDFTDFDAPFHFTPELMSWLPRARTNTSVALDLGCGNAVHRDLVEHAGFRYVGIDYDHEDAPLLADAHALPFRDASFEFVLTMAVLEHIQYPFVMMQEAYRVLQRGGRLIGTVAFLEPFHSDSFFHHTHLGVLNVLQHAGFEVQAIAPHPEWPVLTAQSKTLFPMVPRRIAAALVQPLHLLHRLWWLPLAMRSAKHERRRQLSTTGSFTFIATKP